MGFKSFGALGCHPAGPPAEIQNLRTTNLDGNLHVQVFRQI